jgi:hypothetical protein
VEQNKAVRQKLREVEDRGTWEQADHGASTINSAEPTEACRTPVDNILKKGDYHVNDTINPSDRIRINHHLYLDF